MNTNEEEITPPHLFERAGYGDNPFLIILETMPEYDKKGGIPLYVLEMTPKYDGRGVLPPCHVLWSWLYS